jgi:hypothetical protein
LWAVARGNIVSNGFCDQGGGDVDRRRFLDGLHLELAIEAFQSTDTEINTSGPSVRKKVSIRILYLIL